MNLSRPMYAHLVASVSEAPVPLLAHEVARVVWSALRRGFPDALACILMPEHLHLLVLALSAEEARRRLAVALAGVHRSKRSPAAAAIQWKPLEDPREITSPQHLDRTGRYMHLNPNRRGLVDDPLRWTWSTYRDVVGAVVEPWTPAERVAQALGRSPSGFVRRYHRYVSGDPSVHVAGTAFPEPAAADGVPSFPLIWVAEASAAATRARPMDIQRRGVTRDVFLHLAHQVGWCSNSLLAEQCSMDSSNVLRRLKVAKVDLAPAALCLGDERLRRGFPSAFPSEERGGSRLDVFAA